MFASYGVASYDLQELHLFSIIHFLRAQVLEREARISVPSEDILGGGFRISGHAEDILGGSFKAAGEDIRAK